MALTEERPVLELTTGAEPEVTEPLGVFRRPTATVGWRSWITTVDHKKIGIMYGVTAMAFFALGGLEALLIRAQLAQPNGQVLTPDQYNAAFTMHGTTMVFLVIMPMLAAFANYLMPLMIGARDVAFPRLNALSYWIFLAAGLFLYSSAFLGGFPKGGWFAYAPNTSLTFSPGHGMDFWALGLQLAGVASLLGAINLIVTALNMRAPGMTLMRMPIFVWMALVAQFLLLFAIPVITVALFLLTFDREFGANFFNPAEGADPILWQHLFWIFGHPEVYILILPAFGIVSEVIPVFARKPLFGYPFMVFSGVAIGFMGWGVWAHHMFASGIGPVSVAAFALSTMFIAVPTGVKIFNWIGTLWGGRLKFTVAMMFSVALVSQFTIGGLSGVTHAVAPADTQQTDTYYIVAHFHYVLFGGSMFGIFSGVYYWFPKVFGRKLSEGIGKLQFWLMFVGFNLTFGPMHILGLQGMPRRVATYPENMGFDVWNMVSTIGSFTIAVSFLVWIYNVVVSRNNISHDPDPWDGRTLEWATASPPPAHNFDEEPVVSHLDEWWHRKYTEDEQGRTVRREHFEYLAAVDGVPSIAREGEAEGQASPIHLPSPSYWPIIVAISLPLIAYGLIFTYWLSALGVILLLGGIYGWGLEPSVDPDSGGHGHDEHVPTPEPDPASVEATVDPDAAPAEVDSVSVTTPVEETAHEAVHPEPVHAPVHHTSTGLSNEKVAMWAFLGSECLLFGGLISTFLLYRGKDVVSGPTVAELYDIPFTSVSSFVLLMSSLTMVLALSAIQRGDMARNRVWLLATALLGATFVAGQVYEFTLFYREGLGFTTNLQSSAFYVLTGFHGAHVTIGILILGSLFVLSLRGKLPPEKAETVEIGGLYWHFVDVVWVVIFTLVYLIR